MIEIRLRRRHDDGIVVEKVLWFGPAQSAVSFLEAKGIAALRSIADQPGDALFARSSFPTRDTRGGKGVVVHAKSDSGETKSAIGGLNSKIGSW